MIPTSKVLVVIQARMGSFRLPGKVLEKIGAHTVIEHVLARVAQTGYDYVVAMPEEDVGTDRLLKAVKSAGAQAFISSSHPADVLGRYAEVLRLFPGPAREVIIRVTSDCPFLDPQQLKTAAWLVQTGAADFATNVGAGLAVDGWDVEAFRADLLVRASTLATNSYDREHVTPWIRRNAQEPYFIQRYVDTPIQFRWTLDTGADLAWFNRVVAEFGSPAPPAPTTNQLLHLMATQHGFRRYSGLPDPVAAST